MEPLVRPLQGFSKRYHGQETADRATKLSEVRQDRGRVERFLRRVVPGPLLSPMLKLDRARIGFQTWAEGLLPYRLNAKLGDIRRRLDMRRLNKGQKRKIYRLEKRAVHEKSALIQKSALQFGDSSALAHNGNGSS